MHHLFLAIRIENAGQPKNQGKHMFRGMVPRGGPPESKRTNDLEQGGTREHPTAFRSFLNVKVPLSMSI